MFLPNLDGDFVDVSGRRKNRSGGSGRGRRSSAGLLTFGWWCSGCTARASCLFRSFRRHFLKRGFGRGGLRAQICCSRSNLAADSRTWFISRPTEGCKKNAASCAFRWCLNSFGPSSISSVYCKDPIVSVVECCLLSMCNPQNF